MAHRRHLANRFSAVFQRHIVRLTQNLDGAKQNHMQTLDAMGALKMQDRKMTDKDIAGVENAGLEFDGQKCRAGK